MKSVTLDVLKDSLGEAAVIWEKYSRDSKIDNNRYFIFYEGKDRFYYDRRIRTYAKNFVQYEARGKSNVLDLYNKIKQASEVEKDSLENKLFFIDKDYDHINSEVESDIFRTTKYSIENYYVSENVISEILRAHFGLNREDENYQKILCSFRERNSEFSEMLVDMNLWAIACNNSGMRIDFSVLDLKDSASVLMKIGVNKIDKCKSTEYDFNFFKDSYKTGLEKLICQTTGLKKENYISDLKKFNDLSNNIENNYRHKMTHYRENIDCYFRGKQLLWFLVEFLTRVGGKNGIQKWEFQINIKNVMSIFDGLAETPPELSEYLEKKLCLGF